MNAAVILEALRCGKQGCACQRGNRTHCPNTPGHRNGDSNPSFGVTQRAGGPLVHCYAGCSQDDVIGALTARGLWGEERAETPLPIRAGRGGQLVAEYEYRNVADELVAVHGRFEQAGGTKSFAWRLPEGDWRDGLGTVAIHDLPLYRLLDLIANPDETVWFVEGEKATEACRMQGLVAVCLGGGASQQSFGNGLDVLRDRDVVLWPDNDESGAALMGRIYALLPQARYVRPVVPPKGDAWDYFAQGGTVSALEQLLEDASPSVAVVGMDAITVTIPQAAGRVRFEYTELIAQRREVSAQMRVVVDIPGKRRTPYSTRLNLESASGREGIRREIERVYPGKDIEWTALLSEACDLAKETWRGVDYSVDLADVALPEERAWLVDRFMPMWLPTIIFGMGGSGKSYLAADIALHALYGMPWKGRATTPCGGVLVVDYEDREEEWRLRVQQLCDGYAWPFPERGYRYMPGRAIPLPDQVTQVRRIVAENGIGLVIVDSAASACGGELLDVTAASRLINALTDLGPTSLLIAHNTKEGGDTYPFGSIFWHNLVRATHYVEAQQEEGASVVEMAVYNRKANRGKQKPIGMRVVFDQHSDSGPVTIDLTASIPAALQSEAQGNRWAILEAIKEAGHALFVKEIEETTGLSRSIVSAELARNKRWFVNVGRGQWGLLDQREAV